MQTAPDLSDHFTKRRSQAGTRLLGAELKVANLDTVQKVKSIITAYLQREEICFFFNISCSVTKTFQTLCESVDCNTDTST